MGRGEGGGIVIHIQHFERNVRAAEQPSSISSLGNEFISGRHLPVHDRGRAQLTLGHKNRDIKMRLILGHTVYIIIPMKA